jgi:hypothetical protein
METRYRRGDESVVAVMTGLQLEEQFFAGIPADWKTAGQT